MMVDCHSGSSPKCFSILGWIRLTFDSFAAHVTRSVVPLQYPLPFPFSLV